MYNITQILTLSPSLLHVATNLPSVDTATALTSDR